MKVVRFVRPDRPIDVGYTKVFTFEEQILFSLPLWHYALFALLVSFSRYSSGIGAASLPDLAKGLRPIQPRTGPKHYQPDEQAIRKAIRGFEKRGLLARDKKRNESQRIVHYLLHPRNAKPRPSPELE